jgi:hypothetical protein
MDMHVHEAWDQKAASAVDALCARRNVRFGRRIDRDDASVGNEDGTRRYRSAVLYIDDRDVGDRDVGPRTG